MMSAAEPSRFDQIADEVDRAVAKVRHRLEELDIAVADRSNRQPHYDPLRSLNYIFSKTRSVDAEQQLLTVSVSAQEPPDEGEEPAIVVAAKAERFWVGQRSHWEASNERSLSLADFLKSDFKKMICQLISDAQAELARSTGQPWESTTR